MGTITRTLVEQQRGAALAKADRQRMEVADIRRQIRAEGSRDGASILANVMLDPPAALAGTYAWRMIQTVPRVGDAKLRRIMRAAGIDPWARCGRLTQRQRVALAIELRRFARRP